MRINIIASLLFLATGAYIVHYLHQQNVTLASLLAVTGSFLMNAAYALNYPGRSDER